MIEIKNCSKAFGKIQAVNKVTMDIGEREVFGLIGSNGAGKVLCSVSWPGSSVRTEEKC